MADLISILFRLLQVAINGRRRRDALPIEKLGEYDPIPRLPARDASVFNPDLSSINMRALFANGPVEGVRPEKKIVWNSERIKWWLANGAQPSETVVSLLERVSSGICDSRFLGLVLDWKLIQLCSLVLFISLLCRHTPSSFPDLPFANRRPGLLDPSFYGSSTGRPPNGRPQMESPR